MREIDLCRPMYELFFKLDKELVDYANKLECKFFFREIHGSSTIQLYNPMDRRLRIKLSQIETLI